MKFLLGLMVVVLVGSVGWAVSWETSAWQVGVGTVFGYLGGALGAQIGAAVAQAAGWGLIDGVLAPILCAYVGYALGSTVGAWAGVTWTGFRLGSLGDPWFSLLGAGLGTGLAFLLASFTDWEWAFYLSPPLAALGATLAFASFSSAKVSGAP
ncbi:MAG: hypothetical protein NZ651_00980 [Candidatus Bipolaricaulota bacterium]|nr:hypothetical protein [Candidatus Bipolaricaulota bacterium]MDW8126342.1 hypothetical protein [Candidatus Bipolaricaulota bacterium]